MQVAAHPGEGVDQQVGRRGEEGGLCPRDHSPWRTALILPWGLCNSVLSRSDRNKELCPWGLLRGRGGGEAANEPLGLGKEEVKREGGRSLVVRRQ